MELVSVVITTHNRDEDLYRAIRSVLNQSYSNIELLIIDDNSNPSTENVINQFNQKLKYIKSEKKGLACSRNLGLSLSKGNFVVFLDDDDELLKDSISKRKLFFDQLDVNIQSKTAFIYSGCIVNIVNENRVTFHEPKIFGDVSDFIKLGHISTIPSTMFLNKSVLMQFDLKFDESFSSFIDHDFLMSIACNKLHIYFINKALTKTYIFPAKKSMVNDIAKRKNNIKLFLKKWDGLINDSMSPKVKINFYRSYIAKEYSKLFLNLFLSFEISSLLDTFNDLKYFKNKTRFLNFYVVKQFIYKLIRHHMPLFLLRLKK